MPDEIVETTAAIEKLAHWLAKQAGSGSGSGPNTGELPRAFLDLLDSDETLREAWDHGTKLGSGGDTSASGLDWSLALYLRPHLEDGEIAAVLRLHRHGQIGGGKIKGAAANQRIEKILAALPIRQADTGPEARTAAREVEPQPWPAPLAPEAYHGIVGEIVRAIEPETEADPAALLFQFLAGAGNIFGTGAYARVEGDRHHRRACS